MHVALAALAGLLSGPFIHHLAVQAGADRSFSPAEARCRSCGHPVGLSGGCDDCGVGYARVVAVAVATGGLFGLTAWRFGRVWVLGAYLFFAAMTVALFLTDIDHKRIPNRITYPGTPLAAALLAAGAALDGVAGLLPRALLGALAYSGIFAVVYAIARGGFGFGDVKLAVSLGLFCAFLGWEDLFLAGLATAAVGGLVALVALVAGQAGAKTEIPYGPPMIAGTWVAILAGPWLTVILV